MRLPAAEGSRLATEINQAAGRASVIPIDIQHESVRKPVAVEIARLQRKALRQAIGGGRHRQRVAAALPAERGGRQAIAGRIAQRDRGEAAMRRRAAELIGEFVIVNLRGAGISLDVGDAARSSVAASRPDRWGSRPAREVL